MADLYPLAQVWPFMAQLLDAGINPAMLEAYHAQGSISENPDAQFFESAVSALSVARKVLASRFQPLTMERKVALLELILQTGADRFALTILSPDKPDDSAVIRAIERSTQLPEEPKKRAIAAMKQDRLVFQAEAINELRSGKKELAVGQKSASVSYVQRLLQISQQILKTPRTNQGTFGIFTFETSNAISAFQQKVFPVLTEERATGKMDRYTLALLEFIVLIAEPATNPLKSTPGLRIIEDKGMPIEITFKDFDNFIDFWVQTQRAGTSPPGTVPPLKPEDAAKLKYLLGFIQDEAVKERYTQLKAFFDETVSDAKGFLSKVWKSNFWGKAEIIASGGVVASLAGLLLFHSAKRIADGQEPLFYDEWLLKGAGALLKLAKFETETKTDGGMHYRPNEWLWHMGLTSARDDFKSSSGDKVEGGLGGGAEFSVNFLHYKRLARDADLAALKDNGFNDMRVWYCKNTDACYRTYELRNLVQSGALGLEDQVIEITSKDRTPTKLGDIPVVASANLYSKAPVFATKLSLGADYLWDPKDKDHLYRFGGNVESTLGPIALKLDGRFKNVNLKDPAGVHTLVKGTVVDLEATLKSTFDLVKSTGSRSHTLAIWSSFQSSTTNSPSPLLNERMVVTKAGLQWMVTRKDDYTFRFSLQGSAPLLQENMAKPLSPDLKLRAESFGQKFTVTVDAGLQFLNQKADPTWALRFIYRL